MHFLGLDQPLPLELRRCQVFGQPDTNPAGILMDQSGFWTTPANICPCSPAHDIIIQTGVLADINAVQFQFGGSNHPKRVRVWASMDGFTFANQKEVS